MASSITFKSVAKKNKDQTVLADLSFGVEENSVFALVGKNRSGKSLVLKLIVGLAKKDKGNIYIKGQDVSTRLSQIKAILGYMPHSNYLNPSLTIFENLLIHGQLNGLSIKESKDAIFYWADNLNIFDQIKNYASQLAGGALRKIIFVRSILHDPPILLLDNPTKGLDVMNKDLVWSHIEKLKKNKTILFATNDLDVVEKYADRIGLLHKGSIRMLGTMDSLIDSTQGIAFYELEFEKVLKQNDIEEIFSNNKILKPEINDNKLSFYSSEKKYLFYVNNHTFNYGIKNIEFRKYNLSDVYKNVIKREESEEL